MKTALKRIKIKEKEILKYKTIKWKKIQEVFKCSLQRAVKESEFEDTSPSVQNGEF